MICVNKQVKVYNKCMLQMQAPSASSKCMLQNSSSQIWGRMVIHYGLPVPVIKESFPLIPVTGVS